MALLYLGGVLTATVLEYFTGWIMEAVFHTRWWDYSSKKFNLHGYISLPPHYCGEFFLFCFLKYCSHLSPAYQPVSSTCRRGNTGCGDHSVLCGLCRFAYTAFGLSKTFGKWKICLRTLPLICRIPAFMKQGKKLEKSSRASALPSDRVSSWNVWKARREEFIDRFETVIAENSLKEGRFYSEKKEELEKRLDDFLRKYMEIRQKQNVFKRRMVRAYPNLKNGFKRLQRKASG